jgi:hypothetical protein
MEATYWLFVVLIAGFLSIGYGMNHVMRLLERISDDLRPLADQARKREKQARESRMEDLAALSDANEAGKRDMTMDEYRKLEAKAEAAGLTVEEYEAKEAKRTENTPHT